MATSEKSSAVPSSSMAVCCPICYREYCDSDSDLVPRILHCGHSYCTECLRRLLEMEIEDNGWETEDLLGFLGVGGRDQIQATPWGMGILHHSSRSSAHEVTCPVCKSSNHIQDGEVTSLTKNFALLGVHDGYERAAASPHYCQEHDHEQRIYCQDCQQLVCAYCQLYGRHKTHKCLIATEACKPAVEAVKRLHNEMEAQLKELEAGEAAVLASVQQLEQQRERNERKICYYYGKLVDSLQKKRAAEVERVHTWANEQAYVLQSQLKSLSTARKASSRLVEDCRRITECDPLQALSEQEPLSSRAEAAKVSCEGLLLEPIISPCIHSTQHPGAADHLQALVNGLSVSMSLDRTDQVEEEEGDEDELIGPHAQDTQHSADQTGVLFPTNMPKLDSAFPVNPSPSLASPDSTPASYSTPLFSAHHYSPSSHSEEDSTEEEFKALRLRPPLSILMGPPIPIPGYRPHHRLRYDEAAEMADDESEQDVSHSLSPPSPPTSLHVPSIPPVTGLLTHSQAGDGVSVSVAGEGVHISVLGSSWPYHHPSTLLDNGEAAPVDDSD